MLRMSVDSYRIPGPTGHVGCRIPHANPVTPLVNYRAMAGAVSGSDAMANKANYHSNEWGRLGAGAGAAVRHGRFRPSMICRMSWQSGSARARGRQPKYLLPGEVRRRGRVARTLLALARFLNGLFDWCLFSAFFAAFFLLGGIFVYWVTMLALMVIFSPLIILSRRKGLSDTTFRDIMWGVLWQTLVGMYPRTRVVAGVRRYFARKW